MIAATITIAFAVVFDFIILLTGLAVISAILLYIIDSERLTSGHALQDRMAKWRDRFLKQGHTVYNTFDDQNLAKGKNPDALPDDQPGDPTHGKWD